MHYTENAALGLEACGQCNVKIKSLKSEYALFLSSSHLSTHKHKKVAVRRWISLWPSEYICGSWDYPGPDTGSSLLRACASSSEQCSTFPDIVFSSNDGILLQKHFFFDIRKQFQCGWHVPWFPTPFRQQSIKQEMKKKKRKFLREPRGIQHNSITSWLHKSLKQQTPDHQMHCYEWWNQPWGEPCSSTGWTKGKNTRSGSATRRFRVVLLVHKGK